MANPIPCVYLVFIAISLLFFTGILMVDLAATCCYSTDLFFSAQKLYPWLPSHKSVVEPQLRQLTGVTRIIT